MNTKFKKSAIVILALILCTLSLTAMNDTTETKPVAKSTIGNKKSKTADWYKDELCRKVFHRVLRGLYEDGVPTEVADLVVAAVEGENDLEKNFYFTCKLCHASYEAFAAYQKRPDFNGTDGVSTFGNKSFDMSLLKDLRSPSARVSSRAMGKIMKPWIKDMLREMNMENDSEKMAVMEKFAKLAREGNALVTTYKRCEACDAINEIAKTLGK
jgi:hypothetical protein